VLGILVPDKTNRRNNLMAFTNKTFLHAFQAQAARTPQRIALSDVSKVAITYRQTQNYANYVSRKLAESEVGQGDIVAMLLGRTAFFPIAAIGVFQAGAAYMPIDPRYPDNRIAFMLEDSEAKVLISSRELAPHASEYKGIVLYAEDLWVEQEETPEPVIDGEDMDYIIYTSGTTGNPKGTINLHKGLMNLIDCYTEILELNEDDVSGVYCSFAFDVSGAQIFPFLTCGARVDIIPNELMLDMKELNTYINEHGITTTHLPPAIIRFFDPLCEHTKLRTVIVGGDWYTYGPARNFALYNMYGPTETSIAITSFLIDKEYENYPIGKVFKNNKGYIVDENINVATEGEIGELYLSGIQVGAGYWKHPELTAEKFVKNTFSDDPDYQTLYKTGDLCRLLPDGNYEFIGRIDTQVKIRGFRVELGEIEATMRKYEGIKEAICGAFDDEVRGEKYIVGYYTGERDIAEEALKEFLSKSLPYYMIPVSFVNIDEIPLNTNGKYDRKGLAKPQREAPICPNFQAKTNAEQALAECLSELFKGKSLDFDKTFNAAGGDSLGAIHVLCLLMEKHFTVNVTDIINPNHTLRDLARRLVPYTTPITKKPARTWEKPVEWTDEQFNRVLKQYGKENIERIYDLTPFQRLFLTFALSHTGTLHIQNSYTVQGPLDLNLCCAAFSLVARKHPTLQTAFVHRDVPALKQIILSNRGIEIAVVVDEPLDITLERDFRRGFDFEKDNILRIILLKQGTRYTHIIVSVHHVITDGWSSGVLMQDFAQTYRKLANGTPVALLKEEMEYARNNAPSHEDFVNYVSGLNHEAGLAYFLNRLKGNNIQADLTHDYPNPQGNWDCLKEFLTVPQNIVEGIKRVAQECGVSPAAVYEGVFAFLLQKECESSSVVFSSLSNERGYPISGIADIVGCFTNSIVTKISIDSDTSTFADLFTIVQKQNRDDLTYSYVDFSEVEKQTRSCVFLFGYNHYQHLFSLTDDVSVSFDMEYHSAYSNIFLTIEETSSIRLRMEYNPYMYSLDTIKRFLNTYVSVLEYSTTHADAKLSESPVMSKRQGEHIQKDELMTLIRSELAIIRSELSAIRQEFSTHHST
jgi:amino acid adenylation domain-containing protein